MFEKTLTDIVKGIRASKRDTSLYISQCIAEIKQEINSSDMYVKANALQKLTFLQMMGYSMSWATFASIEVMSSPRFAHKRIGYLAASQGFHQDTDVILLTTNLLKKELRSASGGGGSMGGVYDAGLAINCISNIVTEDLAQDLLPELNHLTSHPQPYLRKKAILCLYKLFVKYPQALRLTFAQLQQCLSDTNPAVVSCAVNVITELSDKNPRNYLHLAPAFFDLLTTSSNNWMLIKVVKLLGSLVPEEPRLARKLLEPLAEIVRNTPAKSLNFEAVYAIATCLPFCRKADGSMPASVPEIVALCAQTLRDFVEEKDQNLKYLGLVGFGSLTQSHPKVLSAPNYRPLILACLSDEDVTIRSRALGLLPSMASRKNLRELVSQLLQHVGLAKGAYKLELVSKIVEMCSGDKYALLQDFAWYLDILLQLGHIRGLDTHGELLRQQVLDVALRVLPVRTHAVKRSMEILLEGENRMTTTTTHTTNLNQQDIGADNGRGRHIMPDILPALSWIAGEYSDLIPNAMALDTDAIYIYNNDSEGPYHSIIQTMTEPSNATKLPTSTQQRYIQAAMKVFAAASINADVSDAELQACLSTLSSNMVVFMQSTDTTVQERACSLYGLLESMDLIDLSEDDTTAPGLIGLSDENESDDENLLHILAPHGSKSKAPKASSSSKNFVARCREVANTMNYLLKPSPMKPIGAKAQRKKHQNPIGVEVDLQAPVNLSIFSALIEEEQAHRASITLSMDAVSFTQQRPHTESSSIPSEIGPAFSAEQLSGLPSTTTNLVNSATDSTFQQNTKLDYSKGTASTNLASASDPFYLNSGPSVLDTTEEGLLQSRFQSIQIQDSDNEEEGQSWHEKSRKKKKKKEKRQRAHLNLGVTGHTLAASNFNHVPVYDSDDDDNAGIPAMGKKKNALGNEFDALTMVDLTKPLGEDETMPERKHRVVPERSTVEMTTASKPKKKKKESKKKKHKSKSPSNINSGTGDLLDLGGHVEPVQQQPSCRDQPVFPDGVQHVQQGVAPMSQQQTTSISNAFDDLLDLGSSVQVPQLMGAPLSLPQSSTPTMNTTPTTTIPFQQLGGQAPRLRATIKTDQAKGSPVVDWSRVNVTFTISGSITTQDVSISLMIQNFMTMSPLDGLTLSLKGSDDVAFGSIPPGGTFESPRLGPFAFGAQDCGQDVKGVLSTGNCSVPIKFGLPATLHVSPTPDLSLDSVAQELSAKEWFSFSAKAPITTPGMTPPLVKSIIARFLQMAEVDALTSPAIHGTFAGRTASGVQVRVLIKLKRDSVKVDLKSSTAQIGKAISLDVKRLVL